MEQEKRGTAPQSLVRALELFDLLAKNPPMSIVEISKELGVTRTTIYSLIGPLMAMNYLEKDTATGRYRLGYKFYELGRQYRYSYPFVPVAETYAKELSQRTNCAVSMMVLKPKGIALAVINTDMSQYPQLKPERTMSAGLSACGRVLLAALDEAELEETLQLMEYVKLTEHSVTDPQRLREILRQVRQSGYATEYGEIFSSRGCIGMPVYGTSGKVIAAMSLADELGRLKAEQPSLMAELKATVDELSRVLGLSGTIL